MLGMIVIPEFGRLRQEDLEFQVSLVNIRKQKEGRRTGDDDVQE